MHAYHSNILVDKFVDDLTGLEGLGDGVVGVFFLEDVLSVLLYGHLLFSARQS